ncbi:MAG TPA: FAD-dependent oxidoreductase [Terriglobales bacterium]|nr:FAD-dependent oxidoreductase [Terriglobales bacterium]
MMRKALSLLLCLLFVLTPLAACTKTEQPAGTDAPTFTAGTYTSTVSGMHGPLTLEVTVSDSEITDVKVLSHVETPGVGEAATELIPAAIVESQSIGVDAVTGVTITSAAIKKAAEECLTQAGADVEALKAFTHTPAENVDSTADVVIVGGGGAGVTAAIKALESGASVILIEKMGFLGGNSIVAGGIYNAPDRELQDTAVFAGDLDSYVETVISETPVSDLHAEMIEIVRAEYAEYKNSDRTMFDSPSFFAIQSWNAGDRVGDLAMMRILAENSLDGLKWMESMGMEFQPNVTLASGSLYPRTHSAVMPNGTGYFDAFERKLEGAENYTQMTDTTATGLIMDAGRVVGVSAVGKDGNAVTLHANKGVILATGGFAGNVELRQEYCEGEKWPDLGPQVPTSNMAGVTGDGIFFARDAGAALVNMDQIQLLHVCNPQTGATYDITKADCFVNQNGERFVREDGRRDEMSKAIIAQPGSIMYSIFSADSAPDPATTKALGGMTLQYMLDNNISGYVTAPTLEELAAKLGMPADKLVQTIADFNSYVDGAAKDPIGRVAFQGVKVETGPFYAYPRSPAVHHTMGGVLIDENCRALKADGTPVPGLYCAGEITGVLHGGNRVGGNAIVDFVVFGRIAGENAAAGK